MAASHTMVCSQSAPPPPSLPFFLNSHSSLTPCYMRTPPYLTHNTTCRSFFKHDYHKKHTQGNAHVYYPASIWPWYVCCVCECVYVYVYVYVCVCVCVLWRGAPHLANWCIVLCIYIYICKCTYKDSLGMLCTCIPAPNTLGH